MNSLEFKKSVGIVSIITRVLLWLSIIGLVVSVLGIIILPFLPLDSKLFIGEIGPFRIAYAPKPPDGVAYEVSVLRELKALSIFKAVQLFITFSSSIVILWHLLKVLKNATNNSVFADENGKNISRIGVTIIVFTLAVHTLSQIVLVTIIKPYKYNYMEFIYRIDYELLFGGFLIIFLGKIFNYGSFLQKEYDQTI